MKDSTYQHMCTILVGVASLFRYTGYDMATFIVTSLTHSAHLRNPSAIIDNAGYYGQAVKEMSSCLSFFIVPIILNYIKPKWALVVGSGLFAFYIATFFYINTYLYFSANVLLGVAFTLIYTAFSTYQLQFSTRKTLARNSATAYGIAGFSLLFGGALYIYVTTAHSETAHEAVAVGTQQYRYYSEAETRTMCGFLFACCLISLLIHALLPNKEIPNSLASESPHEKLTLTKQVGVTASVLTNSYILMFIPRFLNYGLFMSFYMNIYPTSLQFSTILASRHPMLTAYYAIAMCAGIAIGGLIIARLNHSFHDFGLRPLYYITMALQLVTYGIAVLTVPNRSTAQPTDDSALTESQYHL